jgi:hypothetical protein
MMLLHFLQRILKTLPWTFSSAIEYFAEQASQTIFMAFLFLASGARRFKGFEPRVAPPSLVKIVSPAANASPGA